MIEFTAGTPIDYRKIRASDFARYREYHITNAEVLRGRVSDRLTRLVFQSPKGSERSPLEEDDRFRDPYLYGLAQVKLVNVTETPGLIGVDFIPIVRGAFMSEEHEYHLDLNPATFINRPLVMPSVSAFFAVSDAEMEIAMRDESLLRKSLDSF